ncbi:hypothetical protein Tco_0283914, partial [Tanacetum coccineum]
MRMSMRLLIFLPFGVSDHSPALLVFPEVKSRKNRAFRLNEAVRKDNGSNRAGSNAMDMDMLKSTSGTKPMSFISTMQGMNASGNNKLSKIPVRVNKEGNNVVDMDPLLEERGHLRRMWRTRDLVEIINNECGWLSSGL